MTEERRALSHGLTIVCNCNTSPLYIDVDHALICEKNKNFFFFLLSLNTREFHVHMSTSDVRSFKECVMQFSTSILLTLFLMLCRIPQELLGDRSTRAERRVVLCYDRFVNDY